MLVSMPPAESAKPHPAPATREVPWTIRRVLMWTVEEFTKRKVETPRLDADVLLAHALGVTRLQLYLDMDKPLKGDELTSFKAMVRRRASREPVSHILGRREFWGRTFTVTKDTLAPRPETELIIEDVLACCKTRTVPVGSVVDVGTGTGCLAITLALEIPAVVVTAVDLSEQALEVARANSVGLKATIHCIAGDMDAGLPQEARYDVVVSNPPYLTQPEWECAPPEVRDHEPAMALVGADADGLGHHRALLKRFWPRVQPGGGLWAEIGSTQGEAASALWQAGVEVGASVTVLKDLAGLDRVVRVLKPAG